MKNFCKQIDNFDAAVFSVFNQDFLFSASTVTYFPITKCAKDILLSDYFDSNRVSDSIISKYSSDEISTLRGRPSTRFLPLTSIAPSPS